ncbi:hypothetical protein ABIA32_006600 [Streptacidiphilus sp. MAP12-20]|uniref:hypothetical protein n=1 Tax=Streptacidiphilus sp. MAP12-20 TaxID=3156299 RepID=UPI003517E747
MTIAAYIETDRHTRIACTGPGDPLPRFWITTANHAQIEISVPAADQDALAFLAAVVSTCQRLHDQIAKSQKP